MLPTYQEMISLENLMRSFLRFRIGKKDKGDVLDFSMNLITEIYCLHEELQNQTYRHGTYHHFVVTDPKKRDIHKASVRDRIVHHMIYDAVYPYFDKKFIYDSYSCRKHKGTHRALDRFSVFIRQCSCDYQKTVYVLKCDIRKFFASIDHTILKNILQKHITDQDMLYVIKNIIHSFHTRNQVGKGLPLGNLTSQILINIYMNECDQFVKHHLKQKYYIRYADDFIFLSIHKKELEEVKNKIKIFLKQELELELHPDKVFIKTIASGLDFLGWIHFEHHRVLRTVTKRRMIKNIIKNNKKQVRTSYLGLLKHGNTYTIQKRYFGVY